MTRDSLARPHAFVPDRVGTKCTLCNHGQGHSLHVAYEDIQPESDSGQRLRLIQDDRR
jgi:hypothetical protein